MRELSAWAIGVMEGEQMKKEPDYRKRELCPNCKYHGDISGKYGTTMMCNYSMHTQTTALKHGPGRTVIDSRGEDRNQCALYEEGKPEKVKPKKQLFRPKEVSYGTGYTGDIDRWNG